MLIEATDLKELVLAADQAQENSNRQLDHWITLQTKMFQAGEKLDDSNPDFVALEAHKKVSDEAHKAYVLAAARVVVAVRFAIDRAELPAHRINTNNA